MKAPTASTPPPHRHATLQALLAAPILPLLMACATNTEVEVQELMMPFERFVGGEWLMTMDSGNTQSDVFRWGPGKHSMQAQIYGNGGGGEPWRALRVFYWHPDHNQLQMLTLSPFANGVAEGSIRYSNETLEAEYDLFQHGNLREMRMTWTFDGPDTYRLALFERGTVPLGVWTYVRSKEESAKNALHDEDALTPPKHLQAFESLLGHTWEARGEWSGGEAFHISSTFEWIPYCEGIYVRTMGRSDDEESHLFDTYIYYHSRTEKVHCLALSNTGTVYEGQVRVLDRGAVEIERSGHDGTHELRHLTRLDFLEDGTVRDRLWSLEGDERTKLLDVRHVKIESR